MGSEGWLHMLLRDPLPSLVWQMPMPILDGANGVAYKKNLEGTQESVRKLRCECRFLRGTREMS